MATLTTPREDERPTRHADYRPHLDGLRAIAVYLVVAFHSEVDRLSGGFIGVDVFFVLSGYLVTSLLVRDLRSFDRVRLARFYARRYRRLLPAAFVALVASAVAFVLVATAAEVSDSKGAFRAAFLYFANWHFIDQSADYFAADINRSPVIHFWSLAIEEQFYLLWPLLLGGLFAIARRMGELRFAFVRAVVALGAVASVIGALHISSTNLNRAYYGTDTRAYQLLAGALLALTPRLFSMGVRAKRQMDLFGLFGIAAILILATSRYDIETIHRGIGATIATCAVIIAIENARAGLLAKSLSQSIAAYLGRLSYGTYLWHWPVIVVLTRETSLEPGPTFAVVCVVATALAAASYHLLELGIRRSPRLDRIPRQVIAVGLALSLLGGLAVVPAILGTKDAPVLKVNGVDAKALDWRSAQKDLPKVPACNLENPDSCRVVRGKGLHVLLLGDSNARMFVPTFTNIAKRDDLTLSIAVYPLCPWQEGLYFLIGVNDCKVRKNQWYGGLVDALDPDVIVVADRPIDDPANPSPVRTPQGVFAANAEGVTAALAAVTKRSVSLLQKDGRKLVIIDPIPIAREEDDPLNCLSSATRVEECIYRATVERSPLEGIYAREVKPGAVYTLDVDRLVCPRFPTCDPVVGGLIVKRDTDHITGKYADAIAEAVVAMLRKAGVLP